MKKASQERGPDMLDEYDSSYGFRGKFVSRLPKDVMVLALGPEVAESFPGAGSVNEAPPIEEGLEECLGKTIKQAQNEQGTGSFIAQVLTWSCSTHLWRNVRADPFVRLV